MDTVELKYSYEQRPLLTINGEQISQYSKAFALLNKPFLETFDCLIEAIDAEVYDDYCLNIYASEFQNTVLKQYAQKSEYCKKCDVYSVGGLMSIEEMYEGISNICKKYNVVNFVDDKTKLYACDDKYKIRIGECFMDAGIDSADLGVFDSLNDAKNAKIPYAIVISDEVEVIHDDTTIIKLPENLLQQFFDYWRMEKCLKGRIRERINALSYVNLEKDDSVELNVYKTGAPDYYLEELPSEINVGERCKLYFRSFPDDAFSLRVDRGCVEIGNGFLIAVSEGSANVSVYDPEGKSVYTHSIRTIQHVYVQRLDVIPRFEYLNKNDRGRIDVIAKPSNAEDINEIRLESSNERVIRIDERGNIVALSPGSAVITISTKRVRRVLSLVVNDDIKELSILPQYLKLKRGTMQILECQVYPPNVPVRGLIWEIDNRSIASINPSIDGRRCQVVASNQYEGKGNIRCFDPVTRIGAICNIEVENNKKPNKLGNAALVLWAIGIFLPVLLLLSIGICSYGLKTDEEENHRTKYIVCIVLSVITGLLWLTDL